MHRSAKAQYSILMLIILMLSGTLLLSGCGGGGGGSDTSDSGGGSSTGGQLLESTTETVDVTGGNVTLSDGSSVNIEGGILKSSTPVSFTKYDSPVTSVEKAVPLSPTYIIELEKDAISEQAETNGGFAKYLTVEIPVAGLTATRSQVRIESSSSIPDDAYNLLRIVIEGDDALTLFSAYEILDGKIVVKIPQESLLDTMSKLTQRSVLKIETTALNVKNYFGVQPALFQVKGPSDFAKIAYSPDLSGKIPIILIHGWQTLSGLTKGGDVSSLEPHKDTWRNFVNYFFSDTELKTNFALFTYRYDSDDSIDKNARVLRDRINEVFGNYSGIILIGHSMGGLLAHTYVQKYGGEAKVSRIITLGTPYHGSPLVQAGVGAGALLGPGVALSVPPFLRLKTPGSLDLAWDNFDNNSNIPGGNDFLAEINSNLHDLSKYTAFFGDISSDSGHGFVYNSGYDLNRFLGYTKSDGIVPMVSALNKGYAGNYYARIEERTEYDYDHSQISRGRCNCSSDSLFVQIKEELLEVCGDNCGNGSGGETLAPTGRFTDNGDGTVTDNQTGLIWLKDAGCLPSENWQNAFAVVNEFNSNPSSFQCEGYSNGYSDWTLPSKEQFLGILDSSQKNPALPSGHPFMNVRHGLSNGYYWTSTEIDSGGAWVIGLYNGEALYGHKTNVAYIWPMRDPGSPGNGGGGNSGGFGLNWCGTWNASGNMSCPWGTEYINCSMNVSSAGISGSCSQGDISYLMLMDFSQIYGEPCPNIPNGTYSFNYGGVAVSVSVSGNTIQEHIEDSNSGCVSDNTLTKVQ